MSDEEDDYDEEDEGPINDNEDDWFDMWAYNIQADIESMDEMDVDDMETIEDIQRNMNEMASCVNHQGDALVELAQRMIVLTAEIRNLSKAFLKVTKLGEQLNLLKNDPDENDKGDEDLPKDIYS